MAVMTISVFACCNEYYAPGLAVALRSLVVTAAGDVAFSIVVVDGDMRDAMWAKVEATVAAARPGTKLARVRPSLARCDGLCADYGASHLAYARLSVDELWFS